MFSSIPRLLGGFLTLFLVCGTALADGTYRLGRPGEKAESKAVVAASTLTITNNGNTFVYKRDKRLDSRDGKYVGYVNLRVQQAIRWPTTNAGRMQIAKIGVLGPGRFSPSMMEIRDPGGAKGGAIDPRFYYRLTCNAWKKPMALGLGRRNRVAPEAVGKFDSQHWRLLPVGKGYFRMMNENRGQSHSLSVDPRTSQPVLERNADVARQYWLLTPLKAGGFQITNYAMDNVALDSSLTMTKPKPAFASSYAWTLTKRHGIVGAGPVAGVIPGVGPGGFVQPTPGVRIVERKIVPNPPLKPVKVQFRNTHSKELWILLHDYQNPKLPKRMKIPAGGSAAVSIERDAGATMIITRETQVGGRVTRETIEKPIPPALLYDVSVYEMKITRIVIDRTKKRPNQVSASPRSIGVFPIPPGAATKADAVFDVYPIAVSEKNPGAVRPLDPKAWGLVVPKDDAFERRLKSGN